MRDFETKFDMFKVQLDKDDKSIEVLALGTSQTAAAINPELISRKAINLSGSGQHHNSDYRIYSQLKERMSSLKLVVVELSFAHFETEQAKSKPVVESQYLEFLNIDVREGKKRFYDRSIFMSNPYQSLLRIREVLFFKEYYGFNDYGFQTRRRADLFKELNYDKKRIPGRKSERFDIRHEPHIFNKNVDYFKGLLDSLQKDGNKIIVCKYPLYGESIQRQKPGFIKRRDSVIAVILREYPDVKLLDLERDSASFKIHHFSNHNHLNLEGAGIFTRKLDSMVNQLIPRD